MSYDQILIDGNFYARRMFAVHKHLSASVDGETFYTGLTHGVLTQLIRLKRNYDGKIIVVWDAGIARRRAIDRDYKRKRHSQEWDELDLFMEHKKILAYFLKLIGVRQAWKQGEEGDDVLHTLAQHFSGTSLIVSNDHDMYQAVTEDTHMLASKKDVDSLWTPRRILKSFGVTPEGYAHSMCLSGCVGDQVAGIPGVGVKTALAVCSRWPMLVPVLLGHGVKEGLSLADWLPETGKGNLVTQGTKAFEEGDKGPDKRLMKILESAPVVEKTGKLTRLYDVWPVTFKKRRKFNRVLIEDHLERCEMHELTGKLGKLQELAE